MAARCTPKHGSTRHRLNPLSHGFLDRLGLRAGCPNTVRAEDGASISYQGQTWVTFESRKQLLQCLALPWDDGLNGVLCFLLSLP